MEGKGAAAWMLLLASLLLLALSPSPTSSFENDDERPTELSSRRIRRDVGGGVWLPVELQQLAEDEIRREAQKPRRKHKRRSQHNPEEEERRRRLWEQQERRRVDEERRRAHEPPRPEEPPQPTTRRPTYEERLREWQRQKEEHDRLVREREKEYEALTVRPLGPPVQQSAPSNVQRAPPSSLSSDDDEEENERKLQDYIERNTPINAPGRGQLMAHSRPPSSRQPWGAAGQRDPYESHEQRGYPAYDYNGNEPERNHHHREGSEQLTPEDERQIAEYHERLETQLAQLHGPARQEFERQARQREDEYRRRLQQDHLREKTGCNQTSSSSSSSSSSGVKGQAQRRPPPASSSVKGAVVDPCASGPYPPYGDARYANRGPDGRPCPPPAPAQSRGETKGPSNDRDPYEQYRRAQESRYRPEQSKGPQPDNRYEEQRRAAEARWRAEQNKGPVVDPYAELRRAEEARYLAQQNKGPPAPYEESRRAQEEARYRAEQNKGAVTPPPPQGRYDEQSEPDWRRVEEMRRAEDSTWIQPAASKGSSNGRPNEDRQETLQPEVWNRVYQASYHRAGDPAESSTHEEQQQPTRPQRPQSAGAPSRYGSHPAAAAAAARPNHHSDDDQAGSMSNVRYEEHRRNEAVVAPGTNPVKQPESGRQQQQQQQQQQQHNANQTAAAAHSTTSPRPPATTAAAAVHPSRNATTENHAPNALRRNDNAIDFMRGLRPDRPGPVASNFPAPVTPRLAAAAKSPSACVWAVVVCCRVQRDPQKLVRCFEAINCPDGNWDEGRCAPPIVGAANHEVGQFYRGSAAARTTTTAQR